MGEPITFRLTEINNESYALSSVRVVAFANYMFDFVSATSSQGQCRFEPGGQQPRVICDLGTLPPGDAAVIDIVVIPQSPGILENTAVDVLGPDSSGQSAGLNHSVPKISASVSVYSA